jgi:hypothetical protein
MRRFEMKGLALRPMAALGAVLFAVLAPHAAGAASGDGPSFALKPGEELTIPAAITDGRVVLGSPHASRLGAVRPRGGEITVGLEREKGTLYDKITATEKTSAPIDFVATGLVGDIKIDERVICGRLDAPSEMHIGSVSWRIVLRDFEVGKGGQNCQ